MVCIFLPLSAIWAGVVNETAVATRGPDSHHRLIQGEFYRSAPNSTVGSNASTSAMENSRQMSVCTCATECKGNDIAATTPKKGRAEYDDDGIYIGREFGFSRDETSDRV
jgi:pheromone alpha factor receptor